MNQLVIPDRGVVLTEGTIVRLARYPGTKWIVQNGWYTYNSQQSMGWYLSSIPENEVIPITEEDLRLLTVLSNCKCNCPGDSSSSIPPVTPPVCPTPPLPPTGQVNPAPLPPKAPMLRINMIRGDYVEYCFRIVDAHESIVQLGESDILIFSVKTCYDASDYMLQKRLGDGIRWDEDNQCYVVEFTHEDTRYLASRVYVFDIVVLYDGTEPETYLGELILHPDVTRNEIN